jgi:hypothetical protein
MEASQTTPATTTELPPAEPKAKKQRTDARKQAIGDKSAVDKAAGDNAAGDKAAGGKAPRAALPGAKRARGVRRPYRGLTEDVLMVRLHALETREETLRRKHDRAADTLGRLRAERTMRAAEQAVLAAETPA